MVIIVHVLLLLQLLVISKATPPRTLYIKVSKNHTRQVYNGDATSALALHKPFTIHVYSHVYVLGIQCSREKENVIDTPVRLHVTHYASPNIEATAAMNGSLECTLFHPPYGHEFSTVHLQAEVLEQVTLSDNEEDSNTQSIETTTIKTQSDFSGSSNDSNWYIISSAVAVLTAIIIAVTTVKVRRKMDARKADARLDDGNHEYERVDYSACRCNLYTMTTSNISNRPQYPLPTQIDEECQEMYTTDYGLGVPRQT